MCYAYKVLWKDSLKSAYAPHTACVEYKLGRWVKAPGWLARRGYYLTVFRSLNDARKYRSSLVQDIWLCEVSGVKTDLPYVCYLAGLSRGEMEPMPRDWPEGTIMARRVKIIKIVK